MMSKQIKNNLYVQIDKININHFNKKRDRKYILILYFSTYILRVGLFTLITFALWFVQ